MTIIFGSEAAKQQLAIGRRMCKLEEQQLLITRFFEIAADLVQSPVEIAELVQDALTEYAYGEEVNGFLMEMVRRAIDEDAMPDEYYELLQFRSRIMQAIKGVKQDEPHLFQQALSRMSQENANDK